MKSYIKLLLKPIIICTLLTLTPIILMLELVLISYNKMILYLDKFWDEDDNIPNDETVKALEESNKGKGINVYSSYEEMYKKIKDE